MPESPDIPAPTLRRLPEYLRVILDREAAGEAWISSETIGQSLGFRAVQVRKDLAALGASGSPRRGFPVSATIRRLREYPGAGESADVFLVGAGSLGLALLEDSGIARHGFRIAEVFDLSPDRVDRPLVGRKVLPLRRLPDLVRRSGIRLAILAVDPDQVGAASLALARAGIAGVLDLTGAALPLPKGLLVRRIGFGAGLAALAGELGARGREKNLDGFPRRT